MRQNGRTFDLRKVIGAVLMVYGLVLTAMGIFGSTAEQHKAAGININLWMGLALVLVALLMLVWAYTKPLIPDEEQAAGRGSGRLRKAA